MGRHPGVCQGPSSIKEERYEEKIIGVVFGRGYGMQHAAGGCSCCGRDAVWGWNRHRRKPPRGGWDLYKPQRGADPGRARAPWGGANSGRARAPRGGANSGRARAPRGGANFGRARESRGDARARRIREPWGNAESRRVWEPWGNAESRRV